MDREAVASYAQSDGAEAYRQNRTLLDNPHSMGTLEHNAWSVGWRIEERFTIADIQRGWRARG